MSTTPLHSPPVAPCDNPLFLALPAASRKAAEDIVALLRADDDILIAAHANPDGDALGACAALGFILQSLGKRCCLYNESPLPVSLDWMPLPTPMCHNLDALPFAPHLALILDCGDAHRVGPALAALLPSLNSINIDHHLATPHYASLYNWIDASMAATGQMIAYLAMAAGLPLCGPLAQNLFVALVTDTGSFSYGNTSAAVLRLAAEIMDQGLDVVSLRDKMENRVSLSGLRFQATLLHRFSLHLNSTVALACVSQQDLQAHHAGKEVIDSVINKLRQIRGVLIAAVLREDAPCQCKLSLRSSGPISVRAIAAELGGGGHTNAAGATINLGLEAAQELLLHTVSDYLDKREHAQLVPPSAQAGPSPAPCLAG